MVLTQAEADSLRQRYTDRHREFAINITDACNMACSICYKDSGLSKNTFIKKSYIKKAISLLDNEWCVCITGGEPLLGLKLVEYTVKLCKKKGITIRLVTNGLLLLDDKIFDKVMSLNIDVITIGYNEFHSLRADQAQKLIDKISDNKIYSHLTLNTLETTDISNLRIDKSLYIIRDDILLVGRGKNYKLNKNYDMTFCTCQGLTMLVNGSINAFCCQGLCSCYFFSIKDKSLIQLFKKAKECLYRYPKFKWESKKAFYSRQCVRGSLLNKDFNDLSYVLTV